jgi:hypothetical protein
MQNASLLISEPITEIVTWLSSEEIEMGLKKKDEVGRGGRRSIYWFILDREV